MSRLGEVANELYGLPLGEFTAARDRRAKELRAEDRSLATAVKALRKPPVAAWAANMLARQRPDVLDEVAAVGAELRQAQADLDRARLRELDVDRKRVLRSAVAAGREVGEGLGQPVSDASAGDLETILRAAMTDAWAETALRTGLLVGVMEATGFGSVDLSGVLAVPDVAAASTEAEDGADARAEGSAAETTGAAADRPARRSGTAGKGRRVPQRDAADAAVETAEATEKARVAEQRERERARARAAKDLERATARATTAADELSSARERADAARARILQLQAEIDELRRRIDEREHALDVAEDERAVADDRVGRAERRAEEALAEVDEVRRASDELAE